MSPPLLPTPAADGLETDRVFRALFGAYPDALIVADAAGRIVLGNLAASALLGYSPEELVGLEVDALVPDAVRPRHAAFRHAYGQRPRTRPMGTQMELVARRRDGSEVMVEIALSPLLDADRPLVVAAIRNIGVYPRVKQALQRARYSETLAQIGRLAVDARDPNTLIEQVPAIAAEALEVELATVYLLESNRLGLRVASGVGAIDAEAVGSVLPNDPGALPGCVLSQAAPVVSADLRSESRFTVPASMQAAGLVSALAVTLYDRGRAIGVLMVRSRTAREFKDDEVRFLQSLSNLLATALQRAQSEEALNHAQRLESVGQLTGGIAHDFNNLLTIIQGNLQVIEELPSLSGDPFGQQLVGAAARATRRGAELTRQLLAFSRRQVLQPDAVDVHQMLHWLADMLRRTLDQRIHIDVDAPAGLQVLADPGQLESALLNTAINARDAMPEGGQLRFEARPCSQLPAQVIEALAGREAGDAPPLPRDGFVAIAIADNGTGMPDAVRERAFEPFFTTKEAGRGTGLGLSTVYGFARQSKGAVALDSTPGLGTTLTLYLPRLHDTKSDTQIDIEISTGIGSDSAANDADGSEPKLSDADADGGNTGASEASKALPRGLRVLLVEDDAEVSAVARHHLDTLGCVVTAAASGEAALPLLQAADPAAPPFDLLLTDIALGAGLRGTELAAQAQALLPRLAILLMSGYSAELIEADRDCPQSWELLRKPYTRSELARAMARLVG